MGRGRSDINKRVARAIRERRTQLGLTQENLASKARVSRSYVGDIERGSRNLALDTASRIARALDIRLSELIQRAEER